MVCRCAWSSAKLRHQRRVAHPLHAGQHQAEALRDGEQAHERGEHQDAVHLPAHRLGRRQHIVVGDGHDRDVVEQRQRHDHDRGERLEAEEDVGQDHDEHDVERHRDPVVDVALDPLEDLARLDDGVDDRRQAGRGQDQRRGAAGGVGGAAHRDAAIGLLQAPARR